jgi:homopolymeric O-antigen transport system ATP-binding protein
MPPAIRVSGLSKLYQVGARQQGYKTLRESIADAFWSPVNRIRQSLAPRATDSDGAAGRRGVGVSPAKSEAREQGTGNRSQEPAASSATPHSALRTPHSTACPAPSPQPLAPRLAGENFWALKDVSFEVQPGEVVGIIGRNGAGKSTLLKILSRITEPTSGRIELRGRVGSLLEVGTGFHPELTGRENIYMNGSILGMSRREITRKFDEIVAFAEIEDFLDTPVKRYSSGMYVRLAFAVAAHLEPEILIVDEVLAVGDAAFQNKCLGKMGEVASHGRTVLFVSHNMAAVSAMCRKGLFIDQGRVRRHGKMIDVVQEYMTSGSGDKSGQRSLDDVYRAAGDQRIKFRGVCLRNERGHLAAAFNTEEEIAIHLELESASSLSAEVSYTIKAFDGYCLFTSSTADLSGPVLLRKGKNCLSTVLAPNHLRVGKYYIQLRAFSSVCCDLIPEAISFEIVPGQSYSQPAVPRFPGQLFFPFDWHTECV